VNLGLVTCKRIIRLGAADKKDRAIRSFFMHTLTYQQISIC